MKKFQAFVTEYSLHKIILIMLLLALGSVVLGGVVQHTEPFISFDKFFYILINGKFPHNAFMDTIIWPFDLWFLPWKGVTFMPAFFYVFLGIFLLYIFIKKRDMFGWTLLTIVIGTYFAGLLLAFDWHFIFRERPFVHLPNNTINEATKRALMKWPSFPSGHTRDTTMFATIIAFFAPETRILMILFSVFIAFTRVYTGAHYPTDVLAGLLLGYYLGVLAILVVKDIQKVSQLIKTKRHASKKNKS